jgi:hypothetical protein
VTNIVIGPPIFAPLYFAEQFENDGSIPQVWRCFVAFHRGGSYRSLQRRSSKRLTAPIQARPIVNQRT